MRKKLVLSILLLTIPLISSQEIIWILGDSLSLDYEGAGYPPQLYNLLDSNSRYYNLAKGGEMCEYLINSEIPLINASGEAIVLCGTNDIFQNKNSTEVFNDIREIYFKLIEKNVTTILLTIPPHKPVSNCKRIMDANKLIKEFAKNNNISIVDIYHLLTNGSNCYINDELYIDGVHLTKEGYSVIANAIKTEYQKSLLQREIPSNKPSILNTILNWLRF